MVSYKQILVYMSNLVGTFGRTVGVRGSAVSPLESLLPSEVGAMALAAMLLCYAVSSRVPSEVRLVRRWMHGVWELFGGGIGVRFEGGLHGGDPVSDQAHTL